MIAKCFSDLKPHRKTTKFSRVQMATIGVNHGQLARLEVLDLDPGHDLFVVTQGMATVTGSGGLLEHI
jgi:hypothetical protein